MTIKKWNVPAEWQEPFVAELKKRGADGHAVDDALRAVDAKLVGTDKDPHDAFGDPQKYAESLVLPGTEAARSSRLRAIGLAIIGLVGMFLALWGWTGMMRDANTVAGLAPVVVFVIGAVLAVGAAIADLVLGARADVYALDPGVKATTAQLLLNKLAPWIIVVLTLVGMLLIWLLNR